MRKACLLECEYEILKLSFKIHTSYASEWPYILDEGGAALSKTYVLYILMLDLRCQVEPKIL